MTGYIRTGLRILGLMGLFAFVTVGCAYQGGDVSPLARKLTWYSYLNGDELRAQCQTRQADTLRLVYNAIHTEQIRTYDITIPTDSDATDDSGVGARLQARVLGVADVSKLEFSDLIAPWRGNTATTHLRMSDTARLWTAMENSKAFAPAPEGLFLTSEKFFWLSAICRNGTFSYNAYVWPSDRFDAIEFDTLLFAWDMTGIPVNPPRETTPQEIYGDASPRRKAGAYYQITIDQNGLLSTLPY